MSLRLTQGDENREVFDDAENFKNEPALSAGRLDCKNCVIQKDPLLNFGIYGNPAESHRLFDPANRRRGQRLVSSFFAKFSHAYFEPLCFQCLLISLLRVSAPPR